MTRRISFALEADTKLEHAAFRKQTCMRPAHDLLSTGNGFR